MPARDDARVTPVVSLKEFFKDSVGTAMHRQGLDADDHTAYYVVNLLTLFARSETVYEGAEGASFRPLASILAEAVEATTAEQRNFALQRLGDISLFVAGFFGDSLSQKLVGLDYYVRMGGGAYGWLSESVRGSLRGQVFASVFAELAEKFQEFVDVLSEVRDAARGSDDSDVLRLYETWLRTGSPRAGRLLRRLGIEPNATLDVATRH
ncbi:MAG TPA: hypothetical protein VFV10_03135 [Gammaproteobacteria bacterium]|nr:hypothetical protein [Gammaproteobacteria bacterium]